MPLDKFFKKERLTKTKQFNLVYQSGTLYRSKNLKLLVRANQLSFNRAGFLVSKKNAYNIVGKNRIKRLLKEAYRFNKCKLKSGFDLIIGCLGRPNAKLKLKDVETNLLNLFKQANILC